ncbi:uncharacterized protein [Penaeus vannamei]|uniref:uncharacterized protein n=1 Tax=Penaeus vannamei TaxID=6689 RepID=UPI00387F7F4D
MRVLVLLAAVGATCAAPAIVTPASASVVAPPTAAHVAVPYVPPVTYIARHHAQDELGRASYGYSYPGQFQSEERDALGNVAGAFSYVDADGKTVLAQYTAGEGGFRVRANHLPVAEAPPLKDTPEVTAAKLQFVDLFNAAAIAAAEAPDEGESEVVAGLDDQGHVVVEVPARSLPNPVRDTPEVTAAKIQFVDLFNAAALAAAEAPDEGNGEGVVAGLDDQGHVVVEVPARSIPNPVRDTPEVTAAKLQFVDLFNAAAIAAAEAPDEGESEVVAGLDDQGHVVVEARTDLGPKGSSDPADADTEGNEGEVVSATAGESLGKAADAESAATDAQRAGVLTLGLPEPVKDTPEVTDAKIKFMNLYNAAAIAAAAAPDDVAGDAAATDSADSVADAREEAITEASATASPAEAAEAVTELGSDAEENTEAPEAATADEAVTEIAPVGESVPEAEANEGSHKDLAEAAEASEVNHNEISEAAEVEGEAVPEDPQPANDEGDAAPETPAAATSAQVLSPTLVAEATENAVPPSQQGVVSPRTGQDAPVSNSIDLTGPEEDAAPQVALASQLVFSPHGHNALGPWYIFGLARGAHGSLIPLLSQHPVADAQGAALRPLSHHTPVGASRYAFHYAPRFASLTPL